jgi:predicted Fe-Mo cluster-binding NifX family protein
MIVAVPSIGSGGLDDQVGEHFGRVPVYTLVDTDTNQVEVLPNTSEHMGGVGLPPALLAKAGASVLVCRGLGGRAIAMFEDLGVRVFVGAGGTVRDAVQLYKDGRLREATDADACAHHGEHGGSHGRCEGP